MKKIINKPENVVTEMLDGLAYVHSDLVLVLRGLTSSQEMSRLLVRLVLFLVAGVVTSQLMLVLWVMVCFRQPLQVLSSRHQRQIRFWKLSRKRTKELVSSWLLKIILATS